MDYCVKKKLKKIHLLKYAVTNKKMLENIIKLDNLSIVLDWLE